MIWLPGAGPALRRRGHPPTSPQTGHLAWGRREGMVMGVAGDGVKWEGAIMGVDGRV